METSSEKYTNFVSSRTSV